MFYRKESKSKPIVLQISRTCRNVILNDKETTDKSPNLHIFNGKHFSEIKTKHFNHYQQHGQEARD